jgi:hypothetical protein
MPAEQDGRKQHREEAKPCGDSSGGATAAQHAARLLRHSPLKTT